MRLDAIELEAVRHAAVQAVLEVGHRLVVQHERLPRDVELQIELAQQEVVGGDVADERDEDAAAGLLAREQQRQRRLVVPPEPAEQVDLPGQLEPVRCRSDASYRRSCVRRPARVRRLPHAVTGAPLTCGYRNDFAMPARARASSTRATATRRSRLLASASRISACSAGSSKTWNQGEIGQRLRLRACLDETVLRAASASAAARSRSPTAQPAASSRARRTRARRSQRAASQWPPCPCSGRQRAGPAAGAGCFAPPITFSTATNNIGISRTPRMVAMSMPENTDHAHHLARFGAGARRREQRHDAEDEREGGHQDRPEAQLAADSAASTRLLPCSCSTLANSTIRIAFFAARPMSMMRPICANTLFT